MVSGFEGMSLSSGVHPDGEPSLASEPRPVSEEEDEPREDMSGAPLADSAAENQGADPPDRTAAFLATISDGVGRLAASAEQYHARAAQREGVIDNLHAEVDRLRRGERRGLMRPLLVEICRLRNDLLRQAEDLPGDFDAERARLLLRSYAESVELALEDNGVVTFAPQQGDPFDPRLHRRVGGEASADPGLAGRVARVRRGGYLDTDANTPITPAEVVLYAPASSPDGRESASATGERKEL
jgi:molecular chaperone GrpE (heat shock protein)